MFFISCQILQIVVWRLKHRKKMRLLTKIFLYDKIGKIKSSHSESGAPYHSFCAGFITGA